MRRGKRQASKILLLNIFGHSRLTLVSYETLVFKFNDKLSRLLFKNWTWKGKHKMETRSHSFAKFNLFFRAVKSQRWSLIPQMKGKKLSTAFTMRQVTISTAITLIVRWVSKSPLHRDACHSLVQACVERLGRGKSLARNERSVIHSLASGERLTKLLMINFLLRIENCSNWNSGLLIKKLNHFQALVD